MIASRRPTRDELLAGVDRIRALLEEAESVERAIWPDGPASGHGSGAYSAWKAKLRAALAALESGASAFSDYQSDEDRDCSWCGGEGYRDECDDPIQCTRPHIGGRFDGACLCAACNGSGLAKDQTIW